MLVCLSLSHSSRLWMRSHPLASITRAFIAVIALGRSRSSIFSVLMLYFDINQGQDFADSSWPCTLGPEGGAIDELRLLPLVSRPFIIARVTLGASRSSNSISLRVGLDIIMFFCGRLVGSLQAALCFSCVEFSSLEREKMYAALK